jgi:short-subunit dehydrogenase
MMGEGLWAEYRKDDIDVLALSPGYTVSEFHEVAGMATQLRKGGAAVEDVVSLALDSLGKVPSVMHGRWNKILMNMGRLLPRKMVLKLSTKFIRQMIP